MYSVYLLLLMVANSMEKSISFIPYQEKYVQYQFRYVTQLFLDSLVIIDGVFSLPMDSLAIILVNN